MTERQKQALLKVREMRRYYTLTNLAENIGCTPATVLNWMKGTRPTPRYVKRIEQCFKDYRKEIQ